jgi:hypothetical protein
MVAEGHEPSTFTYNVAMEACTKSGVSGEIQRLFKSLKTRTVSPI